MNITLPVAAPAASTAHASAVLAAAHHLHSRLERGERIDAAILRTAMEAAFGVSDSNSTIHIVAGLLLPVWKQLPNESARVYRLQTDDCERIIGRRVSTAWAANATTTGAANLSAEDAYAALIEGRTILDLAAGLQLRRVRVKGANRIELSGYSEAMRERLRAYGLFTEIISWKLRFFVPVDATGPGVLDKLIATYPVERICEREAA
jgi:hypothetical protein